MTGRPSYSSTRLRLLALVFIAALPGLGLLIYTGGKLRQSTVANAQATALRLAETASLSHNLLIDDARNLLPALAQVPEVLNGDPVACSQRFSHLLIEYPAFANFGAIAPDGQLFCSALPFTPPVYAGDRVYFQGALATRSFAVGDYQIGRVTGKASLNFGFPAMDASGEVRAIVFAALDLEWIKALAGELELPRGTSVTVFDGKGTILASSPDPGPWVGESAPDVAVIKAALETRQKGVLEAPGIDGVPRLFGYTPLEISPTAEGVYISVGIPVDVALAEVRQVQVVNFSTLALALVATLAAAWVGGEVVLLRGVRRLRQASRLFAAGDLTARSGLQNDSSEIGDLGRSFDVMAETIGLREAEIREAADELRRLNRSLSILSMSNKAIVRAKDEEELVAKVCQVVVHVGMYRMAWVGYAAEDEARSVRPMAKAGLEDGYLDAVRISWGEDDEPAEPSGKAIRTGVRQIARGLEADRMRSPWVDEALVRGFAACLALPLLVEGRAMGNLSIFSDDPGGFDVGETQLLEELADDLSFGISHLRSEMKRREIESELMELAQFHRGIVEAVGEGIAVQDAKGMFTFLNPAATALLGYAPDELLGRHWTTIVPEEQRPIIRAADERRRSGVSDSYEVQLIAKGGERVPVIVHGAPRQEGQGINGTVAVFTDLRERHRTEDEIRRRAVRQEELNKIIELAAGASNIFGIMDHLLDHILAAADVSKAAIWLSDRFASRAIPKRAGEVIARKMAGPDIDNSRTLVVNDWNAQLHDGRALALVEVMQSNGIEAAVIVPVFLDTWLLGWICLASDAARPWSTEEIELAEAIARQIAGAAQRQGLMETTREQAQQLQQILDSVQEGIFTVSTNGSVLTANPAATEYLSLLSEGKPGEKLVALAGRPLSELTTPRPDGLPHEIVYPGSPRRVFDLNARKNPEGSAFGGWTFLMREVTSARELQQRAQLQDRLAAVGQLAAGIAHDFNNIIGTVILYSEMLLKEPNLDERARERVTTIFKQGQRAAELTQQVLDFSRRAVVAKHPLDLIGFLREFGILVERTLPENIQLEMDVPEGEVIINADPGRLQQIFMNLTLNARDSMPDGGRLMFKIGRVSVSPSGASAGSGMHAGEWARVEVSDTGSGIEKDVIPHIFEPFFTTRGPGEGTGLGLSQVYGLIRQHEGFIDVYSKIGAGSTFVIHLPSIETEVVPLTIPKHAAGIKGAGQTILVAEDDPATREALREALEESDYRVLMAADGEQALDVIEQQRGSIDLIVSDLVMPRMSGRDLYRVVQERYPGIKMILITGYPLGGDTQELFETGAATWVQKPFISGVLLERIASLLAEESA